MSPAKTTVLAVTRADEDSVLAASMMSTLTNLPKPHAPAYAGFVKSLGVAPETAAMFEDMPHNLEQPHALGMTTVLVHSTYMDHPIQQTIKGWTKAPSHIHHMTEDLTGFLGELHAHLQQLPK